MYNWGEPERAPNLAILLGPRVCILYVWYVRLTESRYKILFLRITYYVCKARGKNGFSAGVQSIPCFKLEAVAHEESDIWTNLLYKRDILQLQG